MKELHRIQDMLLEIATFANQQKVMNIYAAIDNLIDKKNKEIEKLKQQIKQRETQ